MSYSLDVRLKVMTFVANGNSITQTARVFHVGRATIYRWLDRPNLEKTHVTRRNRKIDIAKLHQDVAQYPHKTLRERAVQFGVSPSSICYQLKRLKTLSNQTATE
ncbi:IS630 transposase-related protein [Gloeomargarita sp.]